MERKTFPPCFRHLKTQNRHYIAYRQRKNKAILGGKEKLQRVVDDNFAAAFNLLVDYANPLRVAAGFDAVEKVPAGTLFHLTKNITVSSRQNDEQVSTLFKRKLAKRKDQNIRSLLEKKKKKYLLKKKRESRKKRFDELRKEAEKAESDEAERQFQQWLSQNS